MADNQESAPPARASAREGGLSFVATRPVAITMFILALGVFGVVSFNRLPVDLLPEISYPTLTVRTGYPGAAPEDVEDRISIRVQEALSTLPGLVRSTSISRAAFSDVLVEFNWGTQMTFAVQEVRDRLDGIFLPDGAERPLILRYDPNLDPILRIGVSPAKQDASDEAFIQTRWVAENKIKRELESIEGVAAVNVRGGLEEEILVSVDPYRLDAQNIPANAIGDRLTQENLNASGGQIREGSTDYLVRTLNEFKTVDEIRNLAVVRRENATIRISDLAEVTRTHAERDVITRIDGTEAVEIAIYREAGANIVDVAKRVRETVFGTAENQKKAKEQEQGSKGEGGSVTWGDRQSLNFLGWTLRKEAKIELLSDQSTFIGAAIDDVKWAALLGGALAIAVMWIFLRKMSATLIIGLSIPISVLVTFAPMFLAHVSLNIMSLGGLALGIGMLVDNAIVVLESITRCREEGDDLGAAAVRGVREVSGAITASTLTTVAVFAPIVFVEGIAGQIFGDQALTVVSSLLVSLLVAILFIPMLASRTWLDSGGEEKRTLFRRAHREEEGQVSSFRWILGFFHEFFLHDLVWTWGNLLPNLLLIVAGRLPLLIGFWVLRLIAAVSAIIFMVGSLLTWPIRKLFDTLWGALDVLYPRVLGTSLKHPLLVLAVVVAGSWFALKRAGNLGLELIPEIHQGEFTAHVGLSVGTPIMVSDRIFSDLDRTIGAMDPVAGTAMTVGVEQESLTRKIEGDHTARITVRLKPEASSVEGEEHAVELVRGLLQSHPEVRSVDVTRPTPFAIDSPLAVEVRGHDLTTLARVADQVRDRMVGIEGLTDVRTTMRPGHPEARITFDRDKTLEYGLDLGAVSDFVRDSVLGKVSTRFVEGDERIDIRVRGDQKALASIGDVYDLVVNPETETPVPLRSIASIEEVRGPAEIRRIGNSRAILVTAASTGVDLGGLTTRIEASLADLVTPNDVVVEIGGQKREMDQGMDSLRLALLLAIFLVYVVMASQFESLLQPLIILFSVPLAAVGVILALDLLKISLSVVVFIGLILLAGIVVNNAIVLVDRINSKQRDGWAVREAILDAGRARLRPILMTTATTVLGLLPLTGWLQGLPLIGMLGAGEGAELRAPMAITVVTGLTSSTLLTLIVIPVIFSLLVRDPKQRAIETPPSATASPASA